MKKEYKKPVILNAEVPKKKNNHCLSNDSEAGNCCWCKEETGV